MQARRIARELSLLSISQLPANQGRLDDQQLQNIMLAAVRTLTTEVQEILETAAAEIKRSSDRLLSSETRASDVQSARGMVQEALDLAQTAINRMGMAVELPELIQLTNQKEVRAYTLQVISTLNANTAAVDELLTQSLVDWQLNRLARIDRDILRIAVTEIMYLGVPDKVAINEAVELAKRYSGSEGHRFINGVLRRVTDQIKTQSV
ncbi:MAG: transcription antitermination factor NusB [Trichocoleus desertorum ATA4-8-CV12]|jgi:N utilization substance protein B|nr:transcription antitermination factor NusB [Trichocoleus desertorum ATA4-8-CV12]